MRESEKEAKKAVGGCLQEFVAPSLDELSVERAARCVWAPELLRPVAGGGQARSAGDLNPVHPANWWVSAQHASPVSRGRSCEMPSSSLSCHTTLTASCAGADGIWEPVGFELYEGYDALGQ